MQQFIGTGVALVTPFMEDTSIDFDALECLVNYQVANGVNYLVVLGTTGESSTLTKLEKEKVIQKIVATNNGRLPLVLGIGGNNTAAVVSEIKETNLTDFDAILSVSPCYNKPSQEGIYQHFKAISEVSPKPIILYNVPGRTASNMSPETTLRLAVDFNNIIAIKEASGDLVQAMKIIQHKPDDFLVISGDDMLALPMTLAGGSGVISVIGEGLPKEFSNMISFGLQGRSADAYAIHYKIADAIDLIFEEGNPAGIKSLLKSVGITGDEVRLPLVKATNKLALKIAYFVENL